MSSPNWDQDRMSIPVFYRCRENRYPDLYKCYMSSTATNARIARGYEGHDISELWQYITKNEPMHELWISLEEL